MMKRFFDVHERELQPGHTVVYSASDGRSSSRVRRAIVVRFTNARVTLQPLDGNLGRRYMVSRDYMNPEFEPAALTNVGGAARPMYDNQQPRQRLPDHAKLNNVMIVEGSGWPEVDYFDKMGWLLT